MGSNGARWCLIGYGPNRAEMRKRVAHQIAALFRGEAPGNVPIEQPTLFEFAINLKIAKSVHGACCRPSVRLRQPAPDAAASDRRSVLVTLRALGDGLIAGVSLYRALV
jgi:hypothetical protein